MVLKIDPRIEEFLARNSIHNANGAEMASMPANIVPQQQSAKSLEEYPLLLNVSDVCELTGLGRNTAYALIRNGQIKHIRVGRLIKVPRSALEEYLRNY